MEREKPGRRISLLPSIKDSTGAKERGPIMSRRNLNSIVRYLRQLTGSANANGASDAELLERYIRHRDEAAFELLLWRHGTLVFNVCRRVLPSEQDAEDAFQATFLAFVRKASSISRRGSVAAWLYKVAYRVALEARERARKTAALEKPGGELLAVQPAVEPVWSDVRPILDAELSRLPERLRRPIVLCYLEGKSNEEAARELGCRLGTIYSRLSRGRELLRLRLQRRGVTLSVTALSAALTASAVEAAPAIPLMRRAVHAALAFADSSSSAAVSLRAATLAEGVLKTMFVTKLKITAVMLLVLGVAAGGVWTQARTAAPQAEARADDPPPKPKAGDKKDAEPITVKVVKPTQGGTLLLGPRPAEIIAAQQQQIVPLISGTVKEVLVDIGDSVKKGQTLLVLDAPLLVQEVEEATASVELARAQVDEAAAIYKAEDVAARERRGGNPEKARAAFSAARAKAKLAQALLDKARIQASFTQLKAAFDGVVTRRTIDPGNFVQPSDSRVLRPLLTVQRIDTVRVVVQVPHESVPLIKRDLPVVVHAFGEKRGEYKISRFSPTLVEDTHPRTGPPLVGPDPRVMTVEIDVPNSENRFLPGLQCQVEMPFKKPDPGSLIVPSSCVLPHPPLDEGKDQRFVYIIRDGKAYRKVVTVGWEDSINAEITEGIQASDIIAVSNLSELRDGKPVKVEKSP
jgi:RND family efflux transporter MFP subunit